MFDGIAVSFAVMVFMSLFFFCWGPGTKIIRIIHRTATHRRCVVSAGSRGAAPEENWGFPSRLWELYYRFSAAEAAGSYN